MDRRKLGTQGLEVSAEGPRMHGHDLRLRKRRRGVRTGDDPPRAGVGVTFLDTAEVYGPYTNEELVGRAVAGRRDQFEIATKFGFAIDPERPYDRQVDGSPENVRRACEESLQRLGVEHIDLYYQHRVAPDVLAVDARPRGRGARDAA